MLQPSQGLIFDRMCGSLRGSVDLGYGTEARKGKGSRNDNFVYSKYSDPKASIHKFQAGADCSRQQPTE